VPLKDDDQNDHGTLLAAGNVNLKITDSVNNSGTIAGRNLLTLDAATINIEWVAALYVANVGGTLTATAGRDINARAAQIANSGAGGSTTLAAGNNVNLETVTEKSTQSLVWDANNYRKEAMSNEVKTTETPPLEILVAPLLLMIQFRKNGDNLMKLDWQAQPIPGKSIFNIELGTSFSDVVRYLKEQEVSDGIIQIANSNPMRWQIALDEEVVRFRRIADGHYDWQCDLALLFFENGRLESVTTYFNESDSYCGLIRGEVGLGDEIRKLQEFFLLKYDNVNEVFLALSDGDVNGLELHGASCELSVDPTQKIAAIRVFLVG